MQSLGSVEAAAPNVAARAAEPPTADAGRCRNCGAAIDGNYCANCGQETAVALPPAGRFLREAAGRYVALDGRLWRTLGAFRSARTNMRRTWCSARTTMRSSFSP
jgi:predicted amidophosphoribosyltransferase